MSQLPTLLQREPPLATVVFNRPEARNALNEAMQRMLSPILAELRDDTQSRVLIFRGARGKAFAAGDDITQFVDWGATEALAHYQHLEAFIGAIEAFIQSKAIVQLCLDNPELRGIADPAAMAASLYDTKDYHAGVQAFLAMQPLPPFDGR